MVVDASKHIDKNSTGLKPLAWRLRLAGGSPRKLRIDKMGWKARTVALANKIMWPLDIRITSARDHLDMWRPRIPNPGISDAPLCPFTAPFVKTFAGSQMGLQEPADFAVIIPTVLRPTLVDALRSVFSQTFTGRVQILIGVDAAADPIDIEPIVRDALPSKHTVMLVYPGYSTSSRHGGLSPAWDGGYLRTIMSYLANSRYLAYLDDDNWWGQHHLENAYARLSYDGAEWVWSLRWFVHPKSRTPICRDEWESIGPEKGFYDFMGGWVDPNCIALDRAKCEAVLRWWSIPKTDAGMDADRNVFQVLRTQFQGVPTHDHTVFYQISETDTMHPHRVSFMGEERYNAAA